MTDLKLVFHEVRVPLNTAMLSVQNLEGERLFDGFSEDQSDMVHGLTGSLSMMEKANPPRSTAQRLSRLIAGPQRRPFIQSHGKRDFHSGQSRL